MAETMTEHAGGRTHQAGFVCTDNGKWLVQIPDNDLWGFHLADDEQTWNGGFGIAKKWEMVPASEVPETVRDNLGWVINESGWYWSSNLNRFVTIPE